LALKFLIDKLEDVAAPLREHYVPENGKFYLATHGEHPKVTEFRATNVDLMRERDALKEKLAAAEAPDVVALKLELATEKGKVAAAEAATLALTHKSTVSAAFLAHGGRPEAVDFIVGKAPTDMTPEKLDEWLKDAAVSKELAFTFQPSKGGSASGGAKPVLGAPAHPNVLRNPSPQELGKHAADIASGKMKIEITT